MKKLQSKLKLLKDQILIRMIKFCCLGTGDVINIPPEVKHWHGAAPNSWFSHLAVEVPAENKSNEWLEAVSQEDYNKLK